MKHIKNVPQRQHITLVLYEAVKVIQTLVRTPWTGIHERTERYQFKEIARQVFNTAEEVSHFLKNYSLAQRYRHYSTETGSGWKLPTHPSGTDVQVLCISNHDPFVAEPPRKEDNRPRWHSGHKRRKGRHRCCHCWYCVDSVVKLDLSPRKALRSLRQQELIGENVPPNKLW